MPHDVSRNPTQPHRAAQVPRNQPAWQDFVEAYEPFLKRMAGRQGVPERHVADVTQQILLSIARSIDGWTNDGGDASFRRWLSTVSRNVVIRFMTRERRFDAAGGTDLLELLKQIPAEPDPQQVKQYEHEMIAWAGDQVRREFRETSWNAFTATVIDGQPVAEVAADLGMTPGSIYMSRSRFLARICAKIQDLLSE
jgi:RNA polymerase sigma-70 factor (ECF subfamily)